MGGAERSGDGLRMVSRVSMGGLGGQGLGCEWFMYKIVEISAASGNNGGGRVLGFMCVEQNGTSSNLAVYFDVFYPVEFFLCFGSSHLCRNMALWLCDIMG